MRWIRTRWGHEVGIVVTAAVLRVGNDRVILLAAASKVVLLEVAGNLVEAVAVVEIVDHVRGVEELGHRGVDVLLGLGKGVGLLGLLGVVREVEVLDLTSVRAVVIDVRVGAFPVLLSKDLVGGND